MVNLNPVTDAKKLLLLAGGVHRKGWHTLDMKGHVDFLATVPPLPKDVIRHQWDVIELTHGIASFYPWEAAMLLRDIYDALAPGGLAIFEQPNLVECIRSGRVEWIYGDPSLSEPEHMVKWAYTPATLTEALVIAGFPLGNIECLPAQYHVPARDFRIEARK